MKADLVIQKAVAENRATLDLSGCGLSEVPDSILELTHLKHLTLSGNSIVALPSWIGALNQLQVLDVSDNELESLPETIGSLSHLELFYFSNNRIKTIPETIGLLKQIRTLYAYENRLETLPKTFGDLLSLNTLLTFGNSLSFLPESISSLKKLSHLDVSHNRFTAFPKCLTKLPNVQYLDVSYNQISIIPVSIYNLTELRTLVLAGNEIAELPNSFEKLLCLQKLRLEDNNLSSLPESLARLKLLRELYLHDNSALQIPSEVLGPTWNEVVRKKDKPSNAQVILDFYFRTRKGAQQPLNEVKLLLVGRGGAGKTSLVRQLRGESFRRKLKETKGITINTWNLAAGHDDYRVNVWDFAGQVITHSTHQFFLTQRSVYILVLTGREDSQTADAEYWLRLIKAFGTDRQSKETSPVIIALNKWDSHKFRIDRNGLMDKYPFIVDFVETDCSSRLGIDQLKEVLSLTISRMESVRQPFLISWWRVKERLETMKKSYLPRAEFSDLCKSFGEVDPTGQQNLAAVLHALGIALNYADDSRLRDTTVLNPHWVTDGIYKLLRDGVRADGSGEMHMVDVARVLPKEKPEMRAFLVELMRRFELAFPLTEDHEQWLVPQRLPDEQPKLDIKFDDPDGTRLCYRYSVLPEGLLPRFITRTYPLSNGLPRWMNGVVLEDDGAKCLIRADISERTIKVAVFGPKDSRRRLVGIVRSDLGVIHNDIKGLNPEELIELTDQPGVYVNLQALEVDEEKGQQSAASTNHGTILVDNTLELDRVCAPDARNPASWKAKIFISYSSADSRQHDELAVRLKPLISEGLVDSWSDRCVIAGQPWDGVIRKELADADVVLFLQSARFVATDYIQDIEVAQALMQASEGRTRVISVILEECDWQRGKYGSMLKEYQALPPKAKPIRDTTPQRNAWYEVSKGLRDVIEDLKSKRADNPVDFAVVKSLLHIHDKVAQPR